ncbi:MAG: hypothetical protein MPJ24_02495 [Pirellulaceae bacterium]|nr:hypothetical protein [Pirellulaceae bacterium]
MYTLLLVPWIEPTTEIRRAHGADNANFSQGVFERNPGLRELFPKESWERQKQMVLETDQMIVFTEKYEFVEAMLKLKPCTLVFKQVDEKPASARYFVMRAPDGATLHFDQPISLQNRVFGKIVAGHLKGDIQIHSPETEPGKRDAIDVFTNNLQITRKVNSQGEFVGTSLSSHGNIDFRLGEHVGKGRYLTIEMVESNGKEGVTTSQESSSLRKLESLEIAEVDYFRLSLPENQLFKKESSGLSATTGTISSSSPVTDQGQNLAAAEPKSPTTVEITCAGSFEVDFRKQVASFHERVRVDHEQTPGETDRLECEKLELFFDNETLKPTDVATQKVSPEKTDSPLGKPRLVVATGNPVRFSSMAHETRIQCRGMRYDLLTDQLTLKSDKKSPKVVLEQPQHYFEAVELQYQLGEKNQLGKLWAGGPGIYRCVVTNNGEELLGNPVVATTSIDSSASAKLFTTIWQKELYLYPDEEGVPVLSFLGNVHTTMEGQGEFWAENIHIWLRQVALREDNRHVHETLSSGGKLAYRPDRMLAKGKVSFDTISFSGATPELKLWFLWDEVSSSATNAGVPSEGVAWLEKNRVRTTSYIESGRRFGRELTLVSNDMTGNSKKVKVTALKPTMNPRSSFMQSVADQAKFHLTGNQILGQIYCETGRCELQKAKVVGAVRLTQLPQNQLGQIITEDLLTVTGNELDILQVTGGDSGVISVRGEPAHVVYGEMEFLSSNLNVDRSTSNIWSEQAGQLILPMNQKMQKPFLGSRLATMEDRSNQTFVGKPVFSSENSVPAEKFNITWQGGLDFDGYQGKLVFTKQVVAQTTTQKVLAHLLRLTLAEPVPLTGKLKKKTELREVYLEGAPLVLENRTFDTRGEWASIERAYLPNLTINHQSGAVVSTGGGNVTVVQKGNSPLSPDRVVAQADRPPQTLGVVDQSSPYYYGKIEYQQGITGNLDLQTLQFHKEVEAIYGPIQEPTASLSFDDFDGKWPNITTLSCELLQMTRFTPEGAKPFVQLLAQNNVSLANAQFEAAASELTYNEQKDLWIMGGTQRAPAILKRTSTLGGGPIGNTTAMTICYWKSLGQVKVENTKSIQFDQIRIGSQNRGTGHSAIKN